MSPSELKELLESLGSSKTYGYCEPDSWENWHLHRLGATVTSHFKSYDLALIKEEIRFALREEGYPGYEYIEIDDGVIQVFANGNGIVVAGGLDELHALASLYLKVKG